MAGLDQPLELSQASLGLGEPALQGLSQGAGGGVGSEGLGRPAEAPARAPGEVQPAGLGQFGVVGGARGASLSVAAPGLRLPPALRLSAGLAPRLAQLFVDLRDPRALGGQGRVQRRQVAGVGVLGRAAERARLSLDQLVAQLAQVEGSLEEGQRSLSFAAARDPAPLGLVCGQPRRLGGLDLARRGFALRDGGRLAPPRREGELARGAELDQPQPALVPRAALAGPRARGLGLGREGELGGLGSRCCFLGRAPQLARAGGRRQRLGLQRRAAGLQLGQLAAGPREARQDCVPEGRFARELQPERVAR